MKRMISLALAILVGFTATCGAGMMTGGDRAAAKTIKTGIVKKSGHHFLYNSRGQRVKKNKSYLGVKYFINDKKPYQIIARKYHGKFYYGNGRLMKKYDEKDFRTLMHARKIVKRITKKNWGKKKKLRKCFGYVMKFPYKTWRKFRRTKNWTAVHADDHFVRGSGNCHSDACAFAYLAAACGFKKVYVCSDTSASSDSSHSWTEVNGRAFDPLFAQAKNFSRNWNSPYGVYELSPAIKVKIPYGKASHNKKGKLIPVKTTKKYAKKNETSLKIVRWSGKDKKLYYSDGTAVAGTVVWKGKFYAFTQKGKFRAGYTKKLRKAAKKNKDIKALVKLIGKPNKKTYSGSCLGEKGDKDGIWKYGTFTVFTFKKANGKEVFMDAS